MILPDIWEKEFQIKPDEKKTLASLPDCCICTCAAGVAYAAGALDILVCG